MPAVREAICRPRRIAQASTAIATSQRRGALADGAAANGTSAQRTPTTPSPKVHTVSIQPELPVVCSATQPSDMISERPADIATSASTNCITVMAQPPQQQRTHCVVRRDDTAGERIQIANGERNDPSIGTKAAMIMRWPRRG